MAQTKAKQMDTRESFLNTGKHILVGAAGMWAGMALVPTRYSFWGGLGLMAYGAWKQKPLAVTAGMGIALSMPADMAMTAGENFRTAQPDPNKSKLQTYFDGVKQKTGMFFQGFAHKMSLDLAKNAMGKGKKNMDTEGMGSVPGIGAVAANPFDTLDELNARLASSALNLQENNPIYLGEEFEEVESIEDVADMEDLEGMGQTPDFLATEDLENPDLDDLEMSSVDSNGDLVGFDLDDF